MTASTGRQTASNDKIVVKNGRIPKMMKVTSDVCDSHRQAEYL